jgi:DNA polymerase-3 subunit chi
MKNPRPPQAVEGDILRCILIWIMLGSPAILLQFDLRIFMAEIRFYHLTSMPVEKALPRLLEKLVATQKKILLLCADEARMKILDAVLWTFGSKAFLPHGTPHDPFPEEQPILVTTHPSNDNHASILVLDNGQELPESLSDLSVIEMFDGTNEEQLQAARTRWVHYKKSGNQLWYFQQDDTGKWVQKAT